MNQEQIIKQTTDYVKGIFSEECSGHDWYHIYRVWKNSIIIGREEKADMYIVQLGALLHDIADFKFHGGDFSVGPEVAKKYLDSLDVEENVVSQVCEIVENVSFKGLEAENPMRTLEGMVVRDADRLDAIGALGIARCFAYGGYKGHPIYLPDLVPNVGKTIDEYTSEKGNSQINHFYEKLLLLKDLMLTEKGRKMAEERHAYMEKFLEEFYREWGEDS